MESIEQMIKRLCPKGVEWKKISEIGTIYRGFAYSKKDFTETGTPCIHYGQIYTRYGTFANKTFTCVSKDLAKGKRLAKKGDLVMAVTSENLEDVGKCLAWLGEDDILVSNHACFIRHSLNPKYLAYFLQSSYFFKYKKKISKGVKVIDLDLNMFGDMLIPVPPLEIQSRIVEVLDKMTTLTAELEAELEARKQQYEYYRNKLLTFSEIGEGNKFVKLGELFDLRNGYTPSKGNVDFWTDGTIPWFRMEDIRANGRILNDSIQHITPSALKGKGLFPAGSFILATTATIGEHALLTTDSLANQQFTNLSVRKSHQKEVNIKFLYYYMFIIDEWCKKNVNSSSFASVDMNKLKEYKIPIPPLSEQQRVVSILDRFEALTTDLQSGLPAEIEARRQQYEYYRNKLLTFDAV